ncbi:cysteine hydrolase family protein [Paraburkholderia bannensis]|uniref:cysteine hydrolase family protein n=1 Tax=Paraburkholderia bannensis TaxID=765414 RepID=UPI0004839BB2|nr:cysteine hydrolase family protein [Paraburkholderia bannensis]
MTTALLVIDFQKGLVATDPLPGDAAAISANVSQLTQRARAAKVPVVFVQHEDAELVPGSNPWKVADAAHAQASDYFVSKRTPDSFLNTALGAILAEHAIQHVVICGYATEFCVDTTTRRAAANGLTVTLAADAHTTHDKPHATAASIREHHNRTLSSMRSFGPRIHAVLTADIAFQ